MDCKIEWINDLGNACHLDARTHELGLLLTVVIILEYSI